MVVKSHFVSTTQTNNMFFKQYDKRKMLCQNCRQIVIYQRCCNFVVKCKKTTFVLFNINILFNLYLSYFFLFNKSKMQGRKFFPFQNRIIVLTA